MDLWANPTANPGQAIDSVIRAELARHEVVVERLARQAERKTQARVLELFRQRQGYDYLGDGGGQLDNRNIETAFLQ